MNALAKIEDIVQGVASLGELVTVLEGRITGLVDRELADIERERLAADQAAERVQQLSAQAGAAEEVRAVLEAYALRLSYHVGQVLAAAQPGKRGGAKGERAQLAESAGVGRQEAGRLVKLAEAVETEEELKEHIAELQSAGRRPTPNRITNAASKPAAAVGGDEWYTPRVILDAGRRVIAVAAAAVVLSYSVDTASNLVAQGNVDADVWYSIEDPNDPEVQARARRSGMDDDQIERAVARWRGPFEPGVSAVAGEVWLNPPYSDPAGHINAVVDAYESRLVRSAFILVNTATDTAVQQRLLKASSARCWVAGRISFLDTEGNPVKGNFFSQVIFYLGDDPDAFEEHFAQFGTVKKEPRKAA